MNVYKPLMIFNITHSITIMTDGCTNFRKFLVEGTKPNLKKIKEYVERSLMLVTALAPVIGYDKASKIAHYAMDNDLTLKAAALQLGFVTEAEFDRVVDPAKMVSASLASAIRAPAAWASRSASSRSTPAAPASIPDFTLPILLDVGTNNRNGSPTRSMSAGGMSA
jgi:fumarate hydratase class II